jgi:hypothetical protein
MTDRTDKWLNQRPALTAIDGGGAPDQFLTAVHLDAEIAAVRADQPRADTKAGSLLQLTTALFGAGLALILTGRLHIPADVRGGVVALLGVAMMLLLAAIVLLTIALRPNLGSTFSFGFVRWARSSDQQILDAVTADDLGDCTRKARQLRWLSTVLCAKFTRIRAAQTLLVLALVIAAAATAIVIVASRGW